MRHEEVIKNLIDNPAGIKGNVTPNVCSQIVAALKFARTMENDKKNHIITAME